MLAEDGSGKGAGLVSAIAQRLKARFDHTSDVQNLHQNEMHQQMCGSKNGFHNTHYNGLSAFTNGH